MVNPDYVSRDPARAAANRGRVAKLGCALIISECKNADQHGNLIYLPTEDSTRKVSQIAFYQLNNQLFSFAKAYYQSPQQNMTMIHVSLIRGTCRISARLWNS